MKLRKNPHKVSLDHPKTKRYTMTTQSNKEKEEGVNMTEMVNKVLNIKLPPHQLRELGLNKNWQKEVSRDFVEQVVKTAEKYKTLLKELSKY